MRIGLVSDIHGNARKVRKLYSMLKKQKVGCFILPGDLGDTYEEIIRVLKVFQKSKVPVYVIPGSHEPVKGYRKAIRECRKTAIIDCTKRRKIKGELDLVFIPGSDWLAPNGGFKLVRDHRSDKRFKELTLSYITDAVITDPHTTLVIAHIPPKFRKDGIDVAHYGKVKKSFFFASEEEIGVFPEGSIVTLEHAKELKKGGGPIAIKKQHVGSKPLRELLKKKKVQFFCCGHIHESGRKGVTPRGKRVRQNSWSKTLWYNVGEAAKGYGGLLIYQDGKMKYKNIAC